MKKSLKGRKSWNKGGTNVYSEEVRKKMSLARMGKYGGANHPNWLGGKSFEPYDMEFNKKLKGLVRKRDNQICMVCWIHREKLNKSLSIHHINYDKKCSLIQNLISLCDSCHAKTNFNRKHWVKLYQSLISEKYNYGYSKDRDIILEVEN